VTPRSPDILAHIDARALLHSYANVICMCTAGVSFERFGNDLWHIYMYVYRKKDSAKIMTNGHLSSEITIKIMNYTITLAKWDGPMAPSTNWHY
jgi:hypothetical protein